MVVTHNDIVNAIINAENIAFMYCQARVNTLSNGVLPTAQQNAAIVELEAWINILEVAEAQWEEGCITSDDTWQVIQNINQLSQEVPCNVSRAISRNSSSGGGSSTPTGYVERVFAYLIDATNPSVLNPIVNNTNPSRPIINLFIDGVSITGTGTEDDPLVAAGGGGTVVSVNGQTGVVVLTTTNIAEGTNQYFTTAKVLATALTGLSITGSSVVSTDTILQAFGKLQNQINSLVGGVIYQGTWNASTNSPTITSGVGTKGYYYVVNVAGTTNIDGITDWEVGDWIIYNGTAWQKVDNTDAQLIPTLQQVLDEGNVSSTYLVIDDGAGNSVMVNNNKIVIENPLGGEAIITSPVLTSSVEFRLPDKVSGQTFAMLSDVTAPIASCGNGTTVTGTTSNTYSKGLLIPANSRGANNAPQIDCGVSKTGTAGTLTIRFYWNTSDDLTGSPILLGTTVAGAASTLSFSASRVLQIEVAAGTGNGTKVMNTTTALSTSWGAIAAAMTSCAIDWTQNGYLIVAVQNSSSADSSVCNMIKLY